MPLLWLSLSFLLGIMLSDLLPGFSWQLWLGLVVAFVLLGIFDHRLRRWLTFLDIWRKYSPLASGVLLAAVAFGGLRYQLAQPGVTPANLAWYNGQGFVRLSGMVEVADTREKVTLLQIQAKTLTLLNDPAGYELSVKGRLQVMLPPGSEWRYGDALELTGRLEIPPESEDFSYRKYLARHGVYSYMAFPRVRLLAHDRGSLLLAGIYAFRQQAHRVIGQLFAQPESGLLAGILLGIENDIPKALQDAFRDTGTSHIIAISGFNISILAGLFAFFAGRLFPNRWVALSATVIGIAFYTVLVGAQASVVRAAIMGSMGLLGRLIGRQQTGANSLAFTAALMTLFNPQLPWDVSFQLSFTATLGLVLYAEPLQEGLNRLLAQRIESNLARRISAPVSEYLLFTLAAQITTLPVILYHFRRLSLTALVANPLILPPQPLVMILGGAAMLAGMIFLPLGKLLGLLAWAPVTYTVRMVEWLARIPQGARTLGEFGFGWLLLFYAILLGVTLWHRPLWAARHKLAPWALTGGAGLLAVGIWSLALSAPDGRLHLAVLNVPDGPAVLLESPSGRTVFIGGSSSANALGSALARRLPLLSQHLDALVIPSTAATPMKALPGIIERFLPQIVLWSQEKASSASARNVAQALEKQNITAQRLQNGQILQVDERITLHVLNASPKGATLLLEYGAFTALLLGEQETEAPQWVSVLILTQKDMPADEQALPGAQVVIHCAAVKGTEAPNRVTCSPAGWVEVITDGRQMWVSRGE